MNKIKTIAIWAAVIFGANYCGTQGWVFHKLTAKALHTAGNVISMK